MNASMETVQALLAGSDRINQMKAEINYFVRTIIGFITESEIREIRKNGRSFLAIEKENIVLSVERLYNGLIVDVSGKRTSHYFRLMEESSYTIPLIFVEEVHSCLPDFLSGMCEHFPGLEDRLAPLFKASGK